MSEIAGRLSVQEGAKYLEKEFGGRGILLGGVPGVQRGKVGILGGGVVGTNACKIAVGIGANVTVLDINAKRLAYLDDIFGSSITTLYATEANIEYVLRESDIVIGAVLVAGETAPRLITRQHLSIMQHGAVIVDVAIDQGGCAETSRPTTHDDPIYIVDDVVHYCVANMPGAVARSSTIALTSVTLPYGLHDRQPGACRRPRRPTRPCKRGINTIDGKCVHPGVAKSCGLPYTEYAAVALSEARAKRRPWRRIPPVADGPCAHLRLDLMPYTIHMYSIWVPATCTSGPTTLSCAAAVLLRRSAVSPGNEAFPPSG